MRVRLEQQADGLRQDNEQLQTELAEHERADQALRKREEQFSAMFQLASIGMAQADVRTGQFLRVNDKMCETTGYSAAEMLKLRLSEITHPEDRERDWEAFQRVVRREAPDYRLEKRYLRKDGTLVWVNVNMTVIRDDKGYWSQVESCLEKNSEATFTHSLCPDCLKTHFPDMEKATPDNL